MGDQLDPQEVAQRIEAVLDGLDDTADAAAAGSARQAGEELVRLLMRFYGAGLEQIVTIARAGGGDAMVHRLASDPLVGGLLALHELHPVDVRARVEHAMATAKRKLGSHASDAELLGLDPDGTVRVQLSAGGCGAETVRQIVEESIAAVAPDTAGVAFIEAERGPTLLQIGLRSAR
ncbi:NifU family protein [Pseudonocardia sp. H11422]|uniref:NifU family protein n=1 Tax=Pseudonocardia sp. H11422 TaxID=2835866 RepID=UPI001BDD3F61|nr:NifU family protein [Pseudonocardia sp. H11422]